MDLKSVINNVSNSVSKNVSKMTKNIPLEYAYVGYEVSKGLAIENTNINGQLFRDLFLYTYLSVDPVVIVLMDDGNFKNLETDKKAPKLEYGELVSKHLKRGSNIDMSEYPSISKNDVLGYFNITKFEDIVKKVIEHENTTLLINLKDTTLKKSYTLSEMNSILKKYLRKDQTNSLIKTFVVPPVMIDELDSLRTVYTLESKFLYDYLGKSDEEIFEDIKKKNEMYENLKNTEIL